MYHRHPLTGPLAWNLGLWFPSHHCICSTKQWGEQREEKRDANLWQVLGPQDWKRSVFIPIPKKGNTKECSNYHTIALISHISRAMLKILQARLQHYMNWELPDFPAGFKKGRGTRDQIANICWIIQKAREFQKNIYSALLTMPKPLTVWITTNWKILKEMGIPDHLTCLLRNLYAGQ